GSTAHRRDYDAHRPTFMRARFPLPGCNVLSNSTADFQCPSENSASACTAARYDKLPALRAAEAISETGPIVTISQFFVAVSKITNVGRPNVQPLVSPGLISSRPASPCL